MPSTPAAAQHPAHPPRQRRASPRITALYLLAILREFRWTLAALSLAVLVGALVFSRCAVDGVKPDLLTSIYAAWMALLAQPIYNPPPTTSLLILCAIYPLIGAVLIGEGVVRLALLMMSRRRGEKEWMRVMVSTYSNHIIICGLGHLGIRVVEQLLSAGATVVALEQHKTGRFVTQARNLGVPVLIRDMKEDQALIDAGIERTSAVVIATKDAIANLEVALDAKRMNAKIRVVMQMFNEQIAHKISDVLDVDFAFSTSTLAAPTVANMALGKVEADISPSI